MSFTNTTNSFGIKGKTVEEAEALLKDTNYRLIVEENTSRLDTPITRAFPTIWVRLDKDGRISEILDIAP